MTVVEWGGGLVEGLATDRLDVIITLAAPGTGQEGAGGVPAGHGPGEVPTATLPGEVPAAPVPGEVPAGTGQDQEPRTVRLEGHGARWDAALAALSGVVAAR